MKTNQRLEIDFGNGQTLAIDHKTLMGSLRNLTDIGNTFRITELKSNGTNKGVFNLAQFLNKEATKSYIEHLKRDEGIQTPLEVRRKGEHKGTYGHLFLLIYTAQQISDRFATRVIKVFVKENITKLRDLGGSDFLTLNVAIDKLSDRSPELKPNGNKGCFIQVAIALRAKIFTTAEIAKHGNNKRIWNTKVATADKQLLRIKYEEQLISLMQMGYVKTYPELKEAISKLSNL